MSKKQWPDRQLHSIGPLAQLAGQIQLRRLELEMTQVQVAQLAKVHPKTIRRIELCQRLPDAETVFALTSVLCPLEPKPWLDLLREAKRIVRKEGGLDAFDPLDVAQ